MLDILLGMEVLETDCLDQFIEVVINLEEVAFYLSQLVLVSDVERYSHLLSTGHAFLGTICRFC